MKRNNPSSKESRAERLKELRAMTGLTRRAFAQKYRLSENTLRHWENADNSGLSEDGAYQMADAYQKESITCTVSWLLHGKGRPPHRQKSIAELAQKHQLNYEEQYRTIPAEIVDFINRHPDAITFDVNDDSMTPFFLAGDTVGGIRCYSHEIAKLNGKCCIAETKHEGTLLRVITNSSVPHKYNLYSHNLLTRIERPYLYDEELLSCALVTRHWRGKKW